MVDLKTIRRLADACDSAKFAVETGYSITDTRAREVIAAYHALVSVVPECIAKPSRRYNRAIEFESELHGADEIIKAHCRALVEETRQQLARAIVQEYLRGDEDAELTEPPHAPLEDEDATQLVAQYAEHA